MEKNMNPDISLTQAAQQQMAKQIKQEGHTGMRISLKAAGCSGLEYILEYADQAQEDDHLLACQGFTLYVDAESYAQALAGLQIDFQKDMLSSAFVYQNPNKKGECGCGISFTI